jgi:hypothetical protein
VVKAGLCTMDSYFPRLMLAVYGQVSPSTALAWEEDTPAGTGSAEGRARWQWN